MPSISLYIHIPFCVHRCGYCDFNSYAGLQELIPEYIQAVCSELKYISRSNPDPLPIHTVYFGGGTPSLIASEDIKKIIDTVKKYYELSPQAEITMEANPGSVTAEYLTRIYAAGVNRISLGMQSARADELTLLERQHSFMDVVNAVEWSRAAGINNLNLDLIFGLPFQQVEDWMTSLEAAIELQPEHLSLYALSIEHGTTLQHKVEIGTLPEPDSDLAADMYEAARGRLRQAGYVHYEISNWAKEDPGGRNYACIHNLQYWRTLPYLGIGAGAHGFINHYRTVNVANPVTYIRNIHEYSISQKKEDFPRTPATVHMKLIDQDTEVGEMMMMGLRLVQEGISNHEFQQRYRVSLREKFRRQIERLIAFGLLEWYGTQSEDLRLTVRGQLLGNQVFSEFI